MDDEDQRWVASLAGRGQARECPEADALRAALLARECLEVDAVPEHDPAREQALLARARAAGLLPPKTASPWRLFRRPIWAALPVAAAASVLFAVLLRPIAPTAGVDAVRGAPSDVIRLRAADPQAAQERIIQDLAEAGVRARRYSALGRYGIDAELPSPLPESVRGVLARHGIPVPADSVLQVQIEAESR